VIGAEYITAFVTLFVIIDPIGLAPVFIALTLGESHRARLRIAFRALIIAAVLLTLFGIFGDKILAGIGISMPAFRIAGGVLLFLTALDMLFERRTKRREAQGEEHEADPETDPSVFPLATPLLAGPGAMATMILLAGREGGDWLHVVAIIAMMLLVLGVVLYFAYGALRDALDLMRKQVLSVEGPGSRKIEYSRSDDTNRKTYYYVIDSRNFPVSARGYNALKEGLRYRAFYTPRGKVLVNIEALEG